MGMRYEVALRMQKEPARSEKAVLLPSDMAARTTLRATIDTKIARTIYHQKLGTKKE